ncbi:hypothetical protein M0813_03946 [Anaeramoeba flamelloides]|uniref:Uncharacterized protein n=1 Tax=Anaeramoeba flamelloides TaxID=1746091 RepID=A0ABQ8XTG7_9EUKA|nr:hypothetical protein M0813_03946 [Anaeramoeba flamelloides]
MENNIHKELNKILRNSTRDKVQLLFDKYPKLLKKNLCLCKDKTTFSLNKARKFINKKYQKFGEDNCKLFFLFLNSDKTKKEISFKEETIFQKYVFLEEKIALDLFAKRKFLESEIFLLEQNIKIIIDLKNLIRKSNLSEENLVNFTENTDLLENNFEKRLKVVQEKFQKLEMDLSKMKNFCFIVIQMLEKIKDRNYLLKIVNQLKNHNDIILSQFEFIEEFQTRLFKVQNFINSQYWVKKKFIYKDISAEIEKIQYKKRKKIVNENFIEEAVENLLSTKVDIDETTVKNYLGAQMFFDFKGDNYWSQRHPSQKEEKIIFKNIKKEHQKIKKIFSNFMKIHRFNTPSYIGYYNMEDPKRCNFWTKLLNELEQVDWFKRLRTVKERVIEPQTQKIVWTNFQNQIMRNHLFEYECKEFNYPHNTRNQFIKHQYSHFDKIKAEIICKIIKDIYRKKISKDFSVKNEKDLEVTEGKKKFLDNNNKVEQKENEKLIDNNKEKEKNRTDPEKKIETENHKAQELNENERKRTNQKFQINKKKEWIIERR